MTRREFMASSSAFLAARALGKGVDTKGVAVGCEIEPWWNPYPTDGLVAMYDVELGFPDGPNVAKDLSGNGYDAVRGSSGQYSVSGKTATWSGMPYGGYVGWTASIPQNVLDTIRTIDIVYSTSNGRVCPVVAKIFTRYYLVNNAGSLIWAQNGYTQCGTALSSYVNPSSYTMIISGGWPIIDRFYQNGQALEIGTHVQGIDTMAKPTSGGQLYIGASFNSGGSFRFCSARFYSRKLPADEVAEISAVNKARFNLP